MRSALLLLLPLFACKGGDEGGDSAGAVSYDVSVDSISECAGDTGSGGADEAFAATSPSAGTIAVSHTGVTLNCCVDLSVSARLYAEGTLAIAYDEGEELCDCLCVYDVAYSVTGVESGSWTVQSGEMSASVEVN